MPHPRARGAVPRGGLRSVSMGRRSPPRSAAEPGAARSGRGPRPRAETGLPRLRSRGGRCGREDALGSSLAPPGPGTGGPGAGARGAPTPPPGVRPAGPGLAGAAAPAPVRPPAPRPAPPAARSPRAGAAASTPPRGTDLGTAARMAERARGGDGCGPQRQRRPQPAPRSPPGPRPPLAQLPARARSGRVAQPTCSVFSAVIAARPGRGQPGASRAAALASALGRRGRR